MTPEHQVQQAYQTLTEGPAAVDRSNRSLIEVSGADRAAWLHNLTTNNVKTLSPGEGQYAFAINVKGRILFDLNILVRQDTIWLDVEQMFLDNALAHFSKYIIMEDVSLEDISGRFVRVALCGRRAADCLTQWGSPHLANLPVLSTGEIKLGSVEVSVLRHDFCGPWSIEFFLPAADAQQLQRDVFLAAGVDGFIEQDVVQRARIEAGIPWPGFEIVDEYLPAETGQFGRAVAVGKGCYLGQEIVERMRSRNIVARRLVRLQIEGDLLPPGGSEVLDQSGNTVGNLTSACQAIATPGVVGLGYVKDAQAEPGNTLRVSFGDQSVTVTVGSLPLEVG